MHFIFISFISLYSYLLILYCHPLEAPVSFTKKLEDVTVAPDNSLTLTCEISKPYARVTWYKDGVRLSYDSRYEIKSRGKEHSLVFDKIKESDSGEYKIKAENDVTCSAKVRVAGQFAEFFSINISTALIFSIIQQPHSSCFS